MKLTAREMSLGLATLAVLVVAGTWLWAESRLENLEDSRRKRDSQRDIVERSQRLLEREDEWRSRLAAIHQRLPRYGEDERVSAALMQMMESNASESNLSLLRATPERERKLGELYEISINYRWEGDLEALIQFLYKMQTESLNLDFRQLSISPSSDRGQGLRLQGGFIVDIAYTRGSSEPEPQDDGDMQSPPTNESIETNKSSTRGSE